MNKCSCWKTQKRIVGWYDSNTPIMSSDVQYCIGTKECEECSCDGDPAKCNFYPEKRKEGKESNEYG